VSLVEVSPSTVTQFSDLSVASASSFCSTPPGTLASVKTKPSMVAMSGAIMPEPLRKPLSVTVRSPILAWRVDSLGKVSVVMIEAAAAAQPSSRAPLIIAGTTAAIFSQSSGWPITPVEAMKTSLRGQPSAWATARVLSSTALSPSLPVKALALPALTMIARTLPRVRFFLHQSTGADEVLDLVSTPAMVAPAGSRASITSSRPWYRTPEAAAASLTPAMRGSVGVILGASGDTAGFMDINFPSWPAASLVRRPNAADYTRNIAKREFYLGGAAGAGADGVAGLAAAGSGLLPSMLNFSILAPERSWSM
jgi:hypothetical protein